MNISSRTGEPMVPVLYVDLDGTIRHGKDELGHFVNVPQDVTIFEGVVPLLLTYKAQGWRIISVSNQGGVALGHMTMAQCASTMLETHKQCFEVFDKMAWCSHHPDASEPEMAVCWCRKPRPGMVIEAALALSAKTGEIYPPHLGLFVGDRSEDKLCAENAGLKFMEASQWRTGKHLSRIREG